MSFVSGNVGSEQAQKFLENLQQDFRSLSADTKKKHPQIKEVSRAAKKIWKFSLFGLDNIPHQFYTIACCREPSIKIKIIVLICPYQIWALFLLLWETFKAMVSNWATCV
jgi:Dimerisation and cyclophilin-binding domain of Mon2